MTPVRESLDRTRARFLLIWVVPIALAAALSFAAPILNVPLGPWRRWISTNA